MKTNQIQRNAARFLFLGLLGAGLGACSIKDGKLTTQSKFSFPNSNVIPIGPVTASVSSTGFITSADLPDDKWRD
jgi:hypothetical protein